MTIRFERSYLQVPYRAVRTPLGLLDDLVVVRVFGAESPAHRVLAQTLQQLDTLAAAAFGDDAGTSPAAPTAAPPAGPKTAPKTAPRPPAPKPAAPAAEEDREQAIPADEQDEIEHLAESFVVDEALAPRAGELAENDELRRVQAEIKAKQSVEDERGQL